MAPGVGSDWKPSALAGTAILEFCAQCMGWEPGSRTGRKEAEAERNSCAVVRCPLHTTLSRLLKKQPREE